MSSLFLYAIDSQPPGFKLSSSSNAYLNAKREIFSFTPIECLNFKYTKIYTHSSTIVIFRTPSNDLLNLPLPMISSVLRFCKEQFGENDYFDSEPQKLVLEFRNVTTNEKLYLNDCYSLNLNQTFVKIGWLTNGNVDIYFTGYFLILLDKKKLHFITIDLNSNGITKHEYKDKRIKQIITGPIGNDFLVLLENDEIYKNGTQRIEFSNKYSNTPILCGSSGGSGFCLVQKYKNRNEIYGMGVPTLGGFGKNFISNFSDFVRIDSDLIRNESSPIISVKAGYWHHNFLLENGKVIGVGFNGLRQANCDLNNSQTVCDFSYNILDTFIPNLGKIKKIGCSSRGSYYWNEKNEIYFIGEVVEKFGDKRITINGKVHNIYKLDLTLLKEQYGNICKEYFPNEVVCGGWHYFFAYDKDVENDNSKDLNYFFTKLKEMSCSNHHDDLSDVFFN
ncbi:hypothetical protein ABK040_006013 [Willaertia magna]